MIVVAIGFAATSVMGQGERHVIQISVDGLHAPALQRLMQSRPDDFKSFRRLFDEGATTLNARTDYFNTLTLPNHTSMLTARPVLPPADDLTTHHGYLSNTTPAKSTVLHTFNPNVEYIASTFDMAHDYGLSTGLYASKEKFVLYEQTYNTTEQTEGGRPDQFPADGDHGSNKIDRTVLIEENRMSTSVVDRFVADMADEPYDYVFLHLTEPDAFGHTEGWRTTSWDDSVALVDQHLGRVFELIDNDERLAGNTTMILTADHGGLGLFHTAAGDPNHFTIPFIAWGDGVASGTDLYNLNLGTRVDPLDERPSYTDPGQPIRNGDAANLAMSLLGLPSVEGSHINARQDLLIDYWGFATWDPTAGLAGDGSNWSDPRNWTRNQKHDTKPLAADFVEFAVNSETQTIDVAGFRHVQSMSFHGDYELKNADLDVPSGRIDLDEGVQVSVEGVVRSESGLVLEGDGNATLTVNGTTDTILVRQGTFSGEAAIEGQIFNFDRVAPGNGIGTMRISQHFTQFSAGVLVMQIDKSESDAPVHDQLLITAALNIRGGLAIEPADGYRDPTTPGDFDRFPLIRMDRRVASRTFAVIEYEGDLLELDVNESELQKHHAGGGLFRTIEYAEDQVTLLNYQAFAGDADGNGSFDSQDIVAVFSGGLYEDGDNDNATWMTGDWNGNLDFESADLVAAFSGGRYEQGSVFDDSAAVANVPEPDVAALFCAATCFLGLLVRRRAGLVPVTS